MSDPLTDASLWKQITRVPHPGRLVDFPRRDIKTGEPITQCFVRVLSLDELQECNAAAEVYAKRQLKDLRIEKGSRADGYANLFSDEICVQILCKAVREPEEPHGALFPSPRTAALTLTQMEFGELMASYFTVQNELGPVVASMTSEEMEAFITRLVEGARCFPLARCSSDALSTLVRHMASRLFPSLTATSSHGSPQNASLNAE